MPLVKQNRFRKILDQRIKPFPDLSWNSGDGLLGNFSGSPDTLERTTPVIMNHNYRYGQAHARPTLRTIHHLALIALRAFESQKRSPLRPSLSDKF